MRSFQVLNVKCEGCANRLKKALREKFGEVEVDLTLEPRVITISKDDFDEKELREELIRLGYPMVDEKLGFFKNTTTKAKSFVSCAIGKTTLKYENTTT